MTVTLPLAPSQTLTLNPAEFLRRLFISQHPEVEARVVEELRGLGLLATPEQPQPRALEHADLSRLTYLTCAIKV